jgi:anti-anti-sigma factor
LDSQGDFWLHRSVATRDGLTIHVHGELDLATAPQLDAALGTVDGAAEVEIDLSAVTFCDGAGLRVLELAHRRLGRRLRVRGASASVRRLAGIVEMEWLAVDGRSATPHYGDAPS